MMALSFSSVGELLLSCTLVDLQLRGAHVSRVTSCQRLNRRRVSSTRIGAVATYRMLKPPDELPRVNLLCGSPGGGSRSSCVNELPASFVVTISSGACS